MNRRIVLSSILALITVILIVVIYDFLNYNVIINSNELNIILTFALAIFASIEASSAFANYRMEKKRKRTVDLRNELEKLYGPIYSVLNNVYIKETNGILLAFDKKMIDKKFSTYPFMISKELYEYWEKQIRVLPTVSDSLDLLMDLSENDRLPANQVPSMEGVYLVPKEFISKVLEEYDKRVNEYRKL